MTEILTSAQMRAVETAAIESGAVLGATLMERAGAGVVAALGAAWPQLSSPGFAVVLCGPGNNGGDGFVIARLLCDRGWRVSVLLYGDGARLPPDASTNFARWSELGTVSALKDPSSGIIGALQDKSPDLIIDALFGTGLTRDLPGDLRQALHDASQWLRHHPAPPKVVAVDIPSGLCADTGQDRGCGLRADLTVSFHRAKLGHYLAEGPALCGAVCVVDIGLPDRPAKDLGDPAIVDLVGDDVSRWLRKASGHKYDHGHALILSGGVARGGAARLAARAALRVGAGLVTLGVPAAALQENAARLDAVMLHRLDGPEALIETLRDARIATLCLGPGLGLTRARGLVAAALSATGSQACVRRAVVLDADALTVFAEDPGALWSLLHDRCVLTPHGGEFRRLFPDLAQVPVSDGPFSKVEAVRAAAKRAGCTVLLKGADTVIAAPSGRCAVHAAAYDRAVPWLATAGAGDVLAGVITGLLARGVPSFEAASVGAWLHVEAARRFGPGLIAEDLPDQIPQVLRGL
ncbi:NAD(P)H-hydrate dehydratase [Pararhodobacter sp.]|uniref:NAD(P)H-hydrate dehydratase n=1 Tax=Pararhodobacter sp. TaxID=2127056 RepID=UPI002AFF387C|nr:NAD(P)H-hydrate dehydratase [Pararhodobacter sp.]